MTCPDHTLLVCGRAIGQPKAYTVSAPRGCFIPFAAEWWQPALSLAFLSATVIGISENNRPNLGL